MTSDSGKRSDTGNRAFSTDTSSAGPIPDFTSDRKVVGRSVAKIDAMGLAAGAPAFVDDEPMRGLLHGVILASPHAHARIRSIDTSKAEAMDGVHAVLCHKNVPRVPHTTAGQGYPEPSPYDTFMFDSKVRYVGDRVAAVAAETREIALEALRLIKVDYGELEPVLDARMALEPGAPIIHDESEARALIPMHYEPKRNMAAHNDFEIGTAMGTGLKSWKSPQPKRDSGVMPVTRSIGAPSNQAFSTPVRALAWATAPLTAHTPTERLSRPETSAM